MNAKEQKRLMVLSQIDRGETTAAEAGESLGLSLRHMRRILAAYRKEGSAALPHGNRGRRPRHALDPTLRQQVVTLARGPYRGCNHQHLSELLRERERVALSRSSVRRILVAAGLPSPRKRRAPKHRARRERRAQEGMLLQIDGSPHAWLEGRGPRLTLVGAMDDATGTLVAAHFRLQEDAQGYMLVFRDILRTKGIPLAVYRDRHPMFARSPKEPWTAAEERAGRLAPTQLERMLEELGVHSIAARSPQAKGRIERLWETLQDRLVLELRLAEANTPAEAEGVLQAYLPRFNVQFAVPAAQPGSSYRPLPPGMDPEAVCCFKYQRIVAQDNTVTLGSHRLQLLGGAHRISYARATVAVHERLDGSLAVHYQGQCVATTAAPAEAPLLRARAGPRPGRLPRATAAVTQAEGAGPTAAAGVGSRASQAVAERGALTPSGAAVPLPGPRPRPGPGHPWRRPLKAPKN